MKNLLLKLFAIVLLAGFFHACNETLVEEQPVDDLELKSAQNGMQSYIVVLEDAELNAELSGLKGYEKRNAAASIAASKVLKRAGVVDGQIGHVYGTAVKGFSVTIPPGQLKKLENDPSVKLIEKNQVVTLIEPKDIKIYEVEAQYTDNLPWGIERVGGGISAYDGDGVAWIIDTGIDLDHPDLNVDGNRGFSAFTRGRDKSPDDGNGHGTHVAGTVAAIINNAGVVGVAPGATVIPVKVLDSRGSGSYDGVIAGVDYVAANGSAGDVANMSLGGPASDALDAAVLAASKNGIKFSLAAGNESDNANNHSPARVNGTNIYTISAMDSNDDFAYFSNYANPPVDYCEPGVDIVSTYKDGGYATASGTSMAAPHMAGILLWGTPDTDGTVNDDPDGNADPIGLVAGGDSGNDGGDSNNPPTADAGPDQSVTDIDGSGNEPVTLDGSGSEDPDGDDLTYSWTENGNQIATGINPEVTFSVGPHTVTLTVSDGEFTDTDEVIITVSESTGSDAPTIGDVTITDNSNPAWTRAAVNWSVSDANGDLQSVKAELFDPSGSFVDSATTYVSGAAASGTDELGQRGGPSGIYSVKITVTDGAGNTTSGSYTKKL